MEAGRTATATLVKPVKAIKLPSTLTVKQFAELLDVSAIDVIKHLMRTGIMANINQTIDFRTAATLAPAFGAQVEDLPHPGPEAPSGVAEKGALPQEDAGKLRPRPSVVTILGHVDHGKTTLLDTIRKTRVAAKEVGGITQHIGAYQVEVKGQKITFLDTPGHEAFTAMRARGAQATDIVVLVVAADDGVMPQTVEAISHAKAAGVPMVVAINKVDKADANPNRVKQQLTEHGVVVEEYGGDVPAVHVSAKQGTGIDDLLETILLVAEIQELKANPERPAAGVVIEAKLDKTKGPVATVLVQAGALKVGDVITAGNAWGRVKAMLTDTGKRVKQAGPAMPVEVLGLATVPQAGDRVATVQEEKLAKSFVEKLKAQESAVAMAGRFLSLEDMGARIKAGEVKELNLILKTDVQGSIEPLRQSLEKLSTEKARVNLLHAGTGSVTDGDVLLAMASKAIVISFNSRVEPGAKRLAETEGVELRHYEIIYNLIDDIRQALEGILEPKVVEVVDGHGEVRAIFSLGKKGKVAGVLVKDGKLARGSKVRLLRGGKGVAEGTIASLKRFKDDVREVTAGLECGVGVQGTEDPAVGDILQCYHQEKAGKPV